MGLRAPSILIHRWAQSVVDGLIPILQMLTPVALARILKRERIERCDSGAKGRQLSSLKKKPMGKISAKL
jgi:hypothetical protein